MHINIKIFFLQSVKGFKYTKINANDIHVTFSVTRNSVKISVE